MECQNVDCSYYSHAQCNMQCKIFNVKCPMTLYYRRSARILLQCLFLSSSVYSLKSSNLVIIKLGIYCSITSNYKSLINYWCLVNQLSINMDISTDYVNLLLFLQAWIMDLQCICDFLFHLPTLFGYLIREMYISIVYVFLIIHSTTLLLFSLFYSDGL